ncbi:multidrug effflux MFS transporter [Flammeovirgaceae bacterium SG7u.111]|nr:multidrug effflux MFS transporter [Flammeovirgaceae bacterium SG7u.132]WPO38372.1 multidrug effflux MFS transporter [Flammeovirgaceae bacterium SG7u.111]
MSIKRSNKYFVPIMSIAVAILATMSPFATDTYLAAMPEMAEFFGVPIGKIEFTITLYLLGFALGNFVGGPLSDSFGRKPIAIIGVSLYGISSILMAFTTEIEQLWALRIIQAFGGGFGTVTSMVFVRDWFEGKQMARMATIIGMIMMVAPMIAPIIGTFIIHQSDWKGIFFFLAFFATVLFMVITLVLPESRKPELITKQLNSKQFFGKYIPFFKSKKAVLMLFTLGFSSASLFVFVTGSSFMYLTYYGFSKTMFPILFGANIALSIILSFLNTILLKWFEPEQILRTGINLQLLAGTVIAITVLVVPHPPIWIIFPSMVLLIGTLGLVFGNGTAIILNLLPEISGSANATIGVTRFVISFFSSSITALFHTNDLVPIGLTIFGSVLLSNIFVFYFRRVHKRSSRKDVCGQQIALGNA